MEILNIGIKIDASVISHMEDLYSLVLKFLTRYVVWVNSLYPQWSYNITLNIGKFQGEPIVNVNKKQDGRQNRICRIDPTTFDIYCGKKKTANLAENDYVFQDLNVTNKSDPFFNKYHSKIIPEQEELWNKYNI